MTDWNFLQITSEVHVKLDLVDYAWASQWRWHWVWDQRGKKRYVRRTTVDGKKPDGSRRQIHVWLHKEILKRKGVKRRTRRHVIADHLNGDSLDCRRCNMRWATPAMNRRNRHGREGWRAERTAGRAHDGPGGADSAVLQVRPSAGAAADGV